MFLKLNISLAILISITSIAIAQLDTVRYDLQQILSMAQQQTIFAKESQLNLNTAGLNYKLYRSELLPQVNASINLPNYNRTFREIIQPNGSIQFQSVFQNNSSLNLGVTQVIGKTGGQVFLQSDLQRFDDFANKSKLYNGIPFRVGLFQPLGAFNVYKWRKKTEPLKLKESTRQYNMELEVINGRAIVYYFELLLSNVNLKIAEYNKDINEQLLDIARERMELGKISESDLLQLKFEFTNSKRNFMQARNFVQRNIGNLNAFLGINADDSPVSLEIPANLFNIEVNYEEALKYAKLNRPEIIRYERELIESQMNLEKAKRENGLNASLFASFGFARGATNVEDIYSDPQQEQQIALQVNIPLVDWGKRKSLTTIARAEADYLSSRVQQDRLDFDNEVKQVVDLYNQYQKEVKLQEEAKNLARQRFEISRQRYLLSDISITELTIAQKEKDQAERDYIFTLREYWLTFYELRRLTGYDFVNKQSLYN